MPSPSRYWREIPQRYRFEANMCSQCGIKFFPPRQICPDCKSRDLEKTKLAEKGKVLTYTIIHVPPSQFSDQSPYVIGIVELEDGVKLTGQIVDCDFSEVKTGMKVRPEFRKLFQEGHAGILCYGYKFVPER